MTSPAIFSPDELRNRRITVMGLGHFGGGAAVVRYLVKQGAKVTLTDRRSEESMEEPIQEISDLTLSNVFFGSHPPEAFAECELLVVNPAVKPDHPVIEQCQAAGIPLVTEIQLLLQHLSVQPAAPANAGHHQTGKPDVTVIGPTVIGPTAIGPTAIGPTAIGPTVIGVTGSNGKSTTAALIHHLLDAEFSGRAQPSAVPRKCWLGGNIGISLLPVVDQIQPTDVVVLELSSFQLHYLQHSTIAPDVAVLTQFSANHLDWHPTMEHYHAAKQNLFRRQTHNQTAVIPAAHQTEGQRFFPAEHDEEDQPTWRIRGRQQRFGIIDDGQDGVFWEDGSLIVRSVGIEDAVRISLPASLAGEHNLHNFTAAACAAVQVGADPMLFPRSVLKFSGLPFRMASTGSVNQIRFINDSAATTPESTMAAVRTLRLQRSDTSRKPHDQQKRLVVIVGGYDKGSSLSSLAECLQQNANAVIGIGDVAEALTDLLKHHSHAHSPHVAIATDLSDAFCKAVELAAPAGIVLFSPGFSSFGWFRNYVDRGQQFDLLVEQWTHR